MVHWLFLLTVVATVQQCCSATHICSSVEKNGLRLYNPHSDNNATGGMLQVCTAAGIWTAVCDYLFKCTAEGKAACKQLGYGGANMRVAVSENSVVQYGSWHHFTRYLYYVCSTTSLSLTSCSIRRTGYYQCNSDDYVGLWCMTMPLEVLACKNGTLRLVGGETNKEGRLEYCYEGVWSQFCNTFHLKEATVACKQLGYTNLPEPLIFTDKRFGILSNYSLFESFTCGSSASEDDLKSCSLSHSCAVRCSTHYGISCYEPNVDNCTEGSMRLVNSTIENEGRIEACRSGNWGPVCGVGEMEAYVVCKALRFDAAPQNVFSESEYGDSTRQFSYGITKCYGWEKRLSDCGLKSHSLCTRSQAAGVICRDGCTNDAIRLTGGSHAAEGTIEVCYDQTWRVVASSHWTPRNSQVVCRQLGFLSEEPVTHASSPFGKPRRSVFGGVRCFGSEAKLVECSSKIISYEAGKTLLSLVNVAGVSCKLPPAHSVPSPTVISECSTTIVCPTPQ